MTNCANAAIVPAVTATENCCPAAQDGNDTKLHLVVAVLIVRDVFGVNLDDNGKYSGDNVGSKAGVVDNVVDGGVPIGFAQRQNDDAGWKPSASRVARRSCRNKLSRCIMEVFRRRNTKAIESLVMVENGFVVFCCSLLMD